MLMMIFDNILYINKCLVGKPNKSINYAPAAPDAAELRRLLKRYVPQGRLWLIL